MTNNFDINSFVKDKNYVIEASAGTGKTHNIVEIVFKLVNDYKINLNEILLVTYTEKAAGELKDRIRKRLTNVDVDNAPIYTIHSFCQNTIKEFGFLSSLPLSLKVIGDDYLKDFAARYVREGDIFNDIMSFNNASDFNFDTLIKDLCESLNKYYLDINFKEDPKIIELSNNMIKNHSDNIKLFNEIKKCLTIKDICDKDENFKNSYNTFNSYINEKINNELKVKNFLNELETSLKNNFIFSSKYTAKTRWSKNNNIDDDLKNNFKYFSNLKDFSKNLLKNETKYLAAKYLKDFYIKYQKEKEKDKSQTFNDMLRYVRESILKKPSPLLSALQKKYRYAIIDEFQDTNQIQFDIFSNIFMSEGHNIIVVGDPKQSIYSFQGADVQVYYKAKEAIKNSSGLILDLNKNYRSSKEMVISCNNLFKNFNFAGTSFSPSTFLDKGDKAGHYEAIYDNKPLQKAFFVDNNPNCDSKSFAKVAVETLIELCSKDSSGHSKMRIRDKSKEGFRDISFNDIAVLARTRSEMEAIENAFKEVGIPFVRYKDKRLFNGKECSDFISLLNAINTVDFTGRNRKIFKKVLFTNFFGLSLLLASDIKFDKDDNDEMRLIKKWQLLAHERKWESLFDDIIVSSSLTSNLSSLSHLQSLGIYKQIANFCIEFLSDSHSLDELINKLGTLTSGEDDEDNENGSLVEKSTNFNSVQIMTMHASKGLQFPIVISVGGFKNKNPKNGSICTYHTNVDGIEKHILDFESNEISKKEQKEEFKRLFYVAYTRAQFLLILPNYQKFGNEFDFLKTSINDFVNQNKDNINLLNYNPNDLLSLKNNVENILKNNEENKSIGSKNNQDKVLKDIIKITPSRSTKKHSYSSFSHSVTNKNEYDENEIFEGLDKYDSQNVKHILSFMDITKNKNLLPSSYPKGSKAGTALHEIFEKIDFTNYKQNLEQIIIRAFRNQNLIIEKDQIKQTKKLLENVLGADLPFLDKGKTSSFKLSSIKLKDKKAEVEFNFNFENEKLKNYCNGFIDLLFIKNGKYYLLDWKSDSLNDDFISYSDNEILKKHVDESYSIQRVLYSYCLIKWLKSFYKNLNEDEIFNNFFGGIYYVFLRGCSKNTGNGIYLQTWKSYKDLNNAYKEIINDRAKGDK